MNTLEQHKKQVNDALLFTGKVGFTNAENLQLVANRKRRGFPTQLVNLGLLLSRKMAGGNLIFGLSKMGADTIGVKQFDIHKLTLGRVEHALTAQAVTLVAIKDLGVVDYEFEPQNISRDTRPDVIWIFDDGSKLYIEIELSAKSISDGDMDRFFMKLLSRNTLVVFRDQTLYSRYIMQTRKYIETGIPEWTRINGKWVKFDAFVKFDRDEWDNIEFQLYKEGVSTKLSLIFEAIGFGY